MLSSVDVAAKLRFGSIAIRYAYLPVGDDQQWRYFDQPQEANDPQSSAHSYFSRNLTRNRVSLTMGPIAMSLSKGHVKKEQRFSVHRHIVDLRIIGGTYVLDPSESVVVMTNEWISLDKDHSALILSCVRNYKFGLVTTASHVDSQWQGILRLLVTNVSAKQQRLSIGAEIGYMFFFECGRESVEDSSLMERTHHYGLTWSKILKNGSDPFDHG